MITTVYIDILFFENFILDFFILYIVSIINNRRFKVLRGTIGSALGAFYVCTLAITDADIVKSALVKLFVITAMLFICFKIKAVKEFFRFFLTFAAVNFILAGGIYFSENIFGGGNTVKITGIFFGAILLAVMGKGFFMLIKDAILKKECTKETFLFYNNKIMKLKTFEDTGNSLVDPISRQSVVIVSKSKAQEMTDISSISKIKNVRLIPCRTVSEKYELLYGFKPDKFIYDNREINAVVAISKDDFLSEGYDAIVNPLTLI